VGEGVEAVELVEEGDGVDGLVGEGRVVHGWRKSVSSVGWDVEEAVAACEGEGKGQFSVEGYRARCG